ncbi:hypothetical protein RGQ29_018416 [Quercus rubra]|uniref:Protein FAR1-RELATED SEQUENCE n=1 Tax=Quercus rubra TaxID=3512 RepID=A0AAN7FNY1_QUERU|nr:hypothetical protein RGQ29_018416 [Quercus rubra]
MIGMKFDFDDNAYEFYKQYAHRMGFNVRKQYVRRGSAGHIKRRTFCCSKEGERAIDKRREQVSFHHPISRIGCLAQMTCQLQKDGMLEVVSFHKQHNHEFAPSPMKHMLRSNRKITLAQQAFADDAEKSGFLNVDYKNHVNSKRREAVMDYFRKMQLEDPSYFYSIQLDDDNQILNIFWADSRSIVDYGHLGDIVCFDTTYRINSYGRPFAPFIGWLFEIFLSAMLGKQPKTIFIDQSFAMANAIEDVFPESNHLNPWLREMFDVKEKWSMVYGRHMFTADMKSTQRSESMNSVLKKYLKPKHGLLQFFGHYSRFKMRQTTPVLQFDFEMLRHAAKLYSPEIFKMFQDEYVKIVDCTIYKASKSDSITEYRVKYRNKTQEHLVKYEVSTTTVQCSCMKFSFLGILCSHALKVLDKKNVKKIPAHFVLKRWTQDAKTSSIKDYRGIDDLQEMRIKCCLSSMEGEVYGEVVLENVLQGDGGFESHVDVSQDICGIKTKPIVGRPRQRLKSSLERTKKKSQSKKDQSKKTSGAR